jgi:hypothetical protein
VFANGVKGSWDNRPRKQDFLDLALLRKHLSVIQDVVVAMPTHFGGHEDYRMFALLEGQLYHKQVRDSPLMGIIVVIVHAGCFHGGQTK